MRKALILVVAALSVASLTEAALGDNGPAHPIRADSIGAARLGQPADRYVRSFGRPIATTLLGNGLTRLAFANGRLEIFLRKGMGVAVVTTAANDLTGSHVGPCATAGQVRKAYAGRLKPVVSPVTHTVAAFTVGRLMFAVPEGRVTAVMLADNPSSYLRLLLGVAACGAGNED
jgi:hypothetical protein